MSGRLLTILAAGLLFGAGLAISGMTDPARVIGFLDLAGDWDPSLAWVMGGAVGTLGVGLQLWRWRSGGRGWFGTTLPERDASPVSRSLVVGAAVFGLGWGLSGICPGPSIANLGALHLEALVFVPMMILGMVVARVAFGVDRD